MLNPDTLRDLTAEQRTQLFIGLATSFYGQNDFVNRLSKDFDVSKATVFRWKKDHNAPWAVIYTLDGWQNTEAMERNVLQDWREVPAQLAEAAKAMQQVGVTLARIARRLPAVRDDVEAS